MSHTNWQTDDGSFWARREQQRCPLCEGIGFRLVEKQGEVRAMKCRCLSRERVSSLQKQSSIPAIYQSQGLEDVKAHSLEEIALLDSLRDILNQQEPEEAFAWVVPSEGIDSQRILALFANDLIRMHGYSCFWLDCRKLSRRFMDLESAKIDGWEVEAQKADFLFIESLRPGCLRKRTKKMLEQVIWERLRRRKAIFLLGEAAASFRECRQYFGDPRLAASVLEEFRVIDSGKDSKGPGHSRWLF